MRKKHTFGLLFFCVLLTNITPALFATPQAVLEWKFEGNLDDTSDNGNYGTSQGNPEFAGGIDGQAIDCDGTGDGALKSGAINIPTSNTEWSINIWVKPDIAPQIYDLIGGFGGDFSYDKGRMIIGWSGNIAYYEYGKVINTGVTFDIGAWQMITATYSPAEQLKIYKNGILIDTGNISGSSCKPDVRIGYYDRAGWSDGFDGKIDEFTLWNAALNQQQIDLLYANPGLSNFEFLLPYAWNPKPNDEAQGVNTDVLLNWSPGLNAASHDVYFGTNEDAVNNASRLTGDVDGNRMVNYKDLSELNKQWLTSPPDSCGLRADLNGDGCVDLLDYVVFATGWMKTADEIYKGNKSYDSNSYNPGTLSLNQTYYWRIDEVNEANPQNPWKGEVWEFTPSLDRGHKSLLEHGLQIQAIVFMDHGFDLNRWTQSNFTSVNFWDRSTSDLFLTGEPPGIPWGRIAGDLQITANEEPYASNFVSVQHGDEYEKNNPDWVDQAASALATLRDNMPDTISYTNQRMAAPDEQGYHKMREYMQKAKPDMLSLGIYIFRNDYWDRDYDDMYRRLQFYRILALEGHDGTGRRPIPQSYIFQTWWDNSPFEIPSDSELRSQLFAAWTMGLKFVNAFVYNQADYPDWIHPALFEGDGDANPRPQFYYQAETNRQSLNLGPAIVRLVSTDLRMIEADQPRPGNIQPWTPDADPYITSISATNLGTVNNGQPGHLLIGYFKPLHEALDGPQYQDQIYFMIYNGLTGADALVSETRQQIDIGFSFGDSGIDSLQRRSRDTGQVELVPLQHMEGSVYKLELVLPGGTADLFKFNTGAPFVGDENP